MLSNFSDKMVAYRCGHLLLLFFLTKLKLFLFLLQSMTKEHGGLTEE